MIGIQITNQISLANQLSFILMIVNIMAIIPLVVFFWRVPHIYARFFAVSFGLTGFLCFLRAILNANPQMANEVWFLAVQYTMFLFWAVNNAGLSLLVFGIFSVSKKESGENQL